MTKSTNIYVDPPKEVQILELLSAIEKQPYNEESEAWAIQAVHNIKNSGIPPAIKFIPSLQTKSPHPHAYHQCHYHPAMAPGSILDSRFLTCPRCWTFACYCSLHWASLVIRPMCLALPARRLGAHSAFFHETIFCHDVMFEAIMLAPMED